MSSPPTSSSSPRPDNKPYFILNECAECHSNLVLADPLFDASIEFEEIWHDEWICPECRDGIYLDIPESLSKLLSAAMDETTSSGTGTPVGYTNVSDEDYERSE